MTDATLATPKVLHVVESLDKGAVETWLVRMLRHARARGLDPRWTFYCTLNRAGALDDEARALGADIVRSPVPIGQKSAFAKALRAHLAAERYDVLHCHHDLVSAVYLASAVGLPIGRRIVHVHNADQATLTPSALKKALLRPTMRAVGLALADRIVGISDHTLDTFLAGRRRRPGRDVVHYYGVDPEPFRGERQDRKALRSRLGLPAEGRLLLFAGRMVPEKNPRFAVEVLAQMRRLDPAVAGVFVGSGSDDEAVRQCAAELQLGDAFHALGWRNDVPQIMTACDWFILPRPEQPKEGFGLAVVEAQLAGLRLLLSRGIPDDPLLPTAAVRRLPLAAGPEAWARAAMGMLAEAPPPRCEAAAALQASPMDMDRALGHLMALHR